MRFDYLSLEAFGHFTDFKLFFNEDKNVHIFYGPNEAGKSTILRSVPNFLYGFPQQTEDSFLHSNQKLRIGGQLKNSDGEKLTFIRRKGRKNTVLDLNNNSIDEKVVQRFLNGMSEEQFLNMFALDHVRLREGGESLLQSDGNVGESLFSAASGISILRNVLDDLDHTSSNLYKKSGSKPEINQALREEKDLTKHINENQLKVQEWKDLEETYLNGEEHIEEVKREFRDLGMQEAKYLRLKKTLPKVALRHELIENKRELGDIPELPDEAEEERKNSLQKLELAETKKKEAETRIQDIDKNLEKLFIPEGLLEQEPIIEDLNREVDGYRQNCTNFPILEGQQRQLKQQVLSILKDIDNKNNSLDDVEPYRISFEKKNSFSNSVINILY